MTNPAPLRCTYCGTISTWSSELVEMTELAENHACPECDQQTWLWDEELASQVDPVESMAWAAPEPLN
jgi:hypothetical protein